MAARSLSHWILTRASLYSPLCFGEDVICHEVFVFYLSILYSSFSVFFKNQNSSTKLYQAEVFFSLQRSLNEIEVKFESIPPNLMVGTDAIESQ